MSRSLRRLPTGALFEESGTRGVEIQHVATKNAWAALRETFPSNKPLVVVGKAVLETWKLLDGDDLQKFLKECHSGLQACCFV